MSVVKPHAPLPNGVSSEWQGWKTGDIGNRQARASSPPAAHRRCDVVWTKKYRLSAVVRLCHSSFQTRSPFSRRQIQNRSAQAGSQGVFVVRTEFRLESQWRRSLDRSRPHAQPKGQNRCQSVRDHRITRAAGGQSRLPLLFVAVMLSVI